MFKSILVAIDGSPTANHGLSTAIALAADQGATLHALHVIDGAAVAAGAPNVEYIPAGFLEGMLDAAREQGREILRRAEQLAAEQGQVIVPVIIETSGITVAEAILKQACELGANVIVLGTHGRRGLRRLVMGSDAETVVRDAKVPVLLVRTGPALAERVTSARAPGSKIGPDVHARFGGRGKQSPLPS